MVMAGYPNKKIMEELGLSCPKTLRKHYEVELNTQHDEMLQDLIQVRENLFAQAKHGKNPIAAIYVMKAFCDRFDGPVKEDKEIVQQQQFGRIEIEVMPGKTAPQVPKTSDDAEEKTH